MVYSRADYSLNVTNFSFNGEKLKGIVEFIGIQANESGDCVFSVVRPTTWYSVYGLCTMLIRHRTIELRHLRTHTHFQNP